MERRKEEKRVKPEKRERKGGGGNSGTRNELRMRKEARGRRKELRVGGRGSGSEKKAPGEEGTARQGSLWRQDS